MLVDLHNHTFLCNHATGSVREYVLRAIELGCKYYGFSEHAPMNFDEKYRLSFEEMELYEKMVREAKDEFKDDLNILLGYEVDFLDGLVDQRVMSRDVDYFIGSVHFIGDWGFDNPEFIGGFKNRDIDKIWQEYFDAIKEMAKSGLFDIVGHIDLMKIFKFMPNKDIKIIAKSALEEIKKANMTIEINTAGLRKPIGEIYPSHELLQLISEMQIPLTLGCDAHSVDHVGRGEKEAYKALREHGYSKVAIFEKRDRSFVNI